MIGGLKLNSQGIQWQHCIWEGPPGIHREPLPTTAMRPMWFPPRWMRNVKVVLSLNANNAPRTITVSVTGTNSQSGQWNESGMGSPLVAPVLSH